MEQKIFNKSDGSRVKLDLEFNRQLWWCRSRRYCYSAYVVCCISYFDPSSVGTTYVKVDYVSITPTCMI